MKRIYSFVNQRLKLNSKPIHLLSVFGLVLIVILNSCSEDANLDIENEPPPPVKEDDVWSISPQDQQALNVVYFKPQDYPVNDEILGDISDMFSFIQVWYAKQMEMQGFGSKTFGLLTNQYGTVKVHVFDAPETSEFYKALKMSDINKIVKGYFDANQGMELSEHTIILGLGGSGVGFAGLGKWCQATTPDNFEVVPSGEVLDGLDLLYNEKLGGIMHELGHGLNLPHVKNKASDKPMSNLMGNGNQTFKNNPQNVYLTKSSCAILNVNSVFNKTDNGIIYYGDQPAVQKNEINIDKDLANNSILFDASFIADTKVTNVYIGFDFVNESASPPNDNYDEITYTVIPTLSEHGVYNVEFVVPYEDLFNGYQTLNKDECEISLNVIFENGIKKVIAKHSYTTDIASMIPNDDIIYNYNANYYNLSDRSAWTAQCNSHSNDEEKAHLLLDGFFGSYWHSNWPYNIAEHGPHEITVNMGTVMEMNGVYLFSNKDGKQFRPKHIIIQTSNDNVTWTEQGNYQTESLAAAKELSLSFANSVSAQYFKIIVDQIWTDALTGAENLTVCEVDVF
ncbi:discoidin domain-containing protein [Carboxylicivirga marina]|uniref:discoidin domain-containing protein n=1 Tax=Carboxylicivirga marina TaxID=2800988 RepID=UPI002596CB38|nr:discoidin domain-containing protein [uncultured Carboxylicivirga sp.]